MEFATWSPRMLSVLRIMTGLMFMEHGTEKLLGFPHPPNPGPALLSLLGLQGVLELVGGLLILIGFLTRPVAFILATWRLPTSWRMRREASFRRSTAVNWRSSIALHSSISSLPPVSGVSTSSEPVLAPSNFRAPNLN